MTTEPGLRQRKKQETRRRLTVAALDLFQQRGYDATTVADIAAAADVAPRTFFSYFDAKEDAVFGLALERLDLGATVIARHAADDPPGVAIQAAFGQVAAHGQQTGVATGLADVAVNLVRDIPAVRARGLYHLFSASQRWSATLADAYRLDSVTATAAVGAATGAFITSALAALDAGQPPAQIADAAERAVTAALAGWNADT